MATNKHWWCAFCLALCVSFWEVGYCGNDWPQNATSTAPNSIPSWQQLAEKFLNNVRLHFSPNRAKARGYDSWSYLDGYSHEVYGKSDYSWIVPLVIVVGFGTLLIPLMGTLMTTMMTQGTINLTAGRRKRRNASDEPSLQPIWTNLMHRVQEAIVKFSKYSAE